MLRIAVGSFVHEANTFAPYPSTWEDITACLFHEGQSLIDNAQSFESAIPGFLSTETDEGIEWVPLISCALPGGSGPLTYQAYVKLRDVVLRAIRSAGRLDACLLSIGGGMVVEQSDLEDADGHLLAEVRAVLPDECRLGVALDMHANVTQQMIDSADIMMAYQTFPPHWDKHEIGARIGALIVAAVHGDIAPVMALASAPMLLQPEVQGTRSGPMRDVMADAATAVARDRILGVSMVAGFGWCDVPEAGTSVIVISDGDRTLAAELADALAERWFARRDQFRFPLVPRHQAVARAAAHTGSRPLLLCDHADNVGAGGAGDATGLLAALLANGVSDAAYSPTCDPDAVAACIAGGVGSHVTLSLGGKRDPQDGTPLSITGLVRLISDGNYVNTGRLWTGRPGRLGRTAVVTVDGIDIVVSERPSSGMDPAVFTSNGIEVGSKSVIVVKSQIFAPESYGDLCDDYVVVDGEGWATSNFSRFSYTKLRRPIFPLDADAEYRTVQLA